MTHRTTSLVLAAAAAAALPAAAAQAAPHWGPPTQVVAPFGDEQSPGPAAPAALFAPDGATALGFTSDATGPRALMGSVRSRLTSSAIAPGPVVGAVQGAVGADDTRAAAWGTEGGGRVAVAAPGGAYGTPVVLPGPGVSEADVAVGADGSATVAWRTRAEDGTFQVLAASLPRGGALGEPQILDAGKAGLQSVTVAAGPGGAAAVAYLKSASGYRAKVAVRPAGAPAFAAAEAISSPPGSDLGPAVAFDADGTAVAAWGNPNDGKVAFRRPGAGAFEAPVSLGGPVYDVALEPTPQGATALAAVGGGQVRAAVQGPAGFALAPVGAAPGQIPPQAAIAVDRAGTTTVVYADPTDGAVKAVTVGGATTTIGYGRREAFTPVALAAGAPGVAATLWRDASGGLSAATYGDEAPASTGPGPKPGAADRTGPKVALTSSRRLTVSTRTTKLALRASCSEACAISVSSSLRTTVKGRKRVGPLTTYTGKLRPAGTQRLFVPLGKLARRDLVRALKAGRGAQLFLSMSATDAAGNVTRARSVSVTLKAKKKATRKR